ncbi:MAG: amidohydrolase [Maricaulaceae bacterium]|nr:amidohydrolase [Maricaulaceae bacterium]
MRIRIFLAAISAAALPAAPAAGDDIRDAIRADYAAHLRALYEHFHANPELSLQEHQTAARLAEELRTAGFEVTEGVGGTGLVAVMENGDGPTLMLRADMDALPLREQTGLSFASTVRQVTASGDESWVMHACAHDTHMTGLVGAARRLAQMRDQWAGTLVLIGQPAEEIGAGARNMINDGLFERFPLPDAVYAFHTFSQIPAGVIAYVPGYAMANVDSVDIRVRGVGGHGSAPHTARDPIAVAGYIITALQTLVSRDIDPLETGVVTVGAIHGGTTHNIIPDEVHMQLTVRSYTDEVRERLLTGIERIARAQAQSAGLPDELTPEISVREHYTPATYNDPALTARAVGVLTARFGEGRLIRARPVTGGEDFGRYGRTEHNIPTFMFWVGGTEPAVYQTYRARGENPPPNHSPFFAPDAETAITQGAESFVALVLDFMPAAGE